MAQRVQVILVDDVNGGEASETVEFALDGVSYEIDLNDENAAKLRDEIKDLRVSEVLDALNESLKDHIFPVLTPLAVDPAHPFPYISGLSLNLAVLVRDPQTEQETFARVKVPKEMLPRFVPTGDGYTFVPLEDLIAKHLDELFPGMEIVDYDVFRVTRDADFTVSDEADDLLQAVEDELRRRRFGEVVRLEVSSDMDPALRDKFKQAFLALEIVGEGQRRRQPRVATADDDEVTDLATQLGLRDQLCLQPEAGVQELVGLLESLVVRGFRREIQLAGACEIAVDLLRRHDGLDLVELGRAVLERDTHAFFARVLDSNKVAFRNLTTVIEECPVQVERQQTDCHKDRQSSIRAYPDQIACDMIRAPNKEQ